MRMTALLVIRSSVLLCGTVRLQLPDDRGGPLPDEPHRWVVTEPRMLNRGRFECALSMRLCHRRIIFLRGDQCSCTVPTEVIHRKGQARLVRFKKLKGSAVLLPDCARGDEVRADPDRRTSEGWETRLHGPGPLRMQRWRRWSDQAQARLSLDQRVPEHDRKHPASQIPIQELERDLRIRACQRAGLDTQVLLLPSCAPKLLLEGFFDCLVPRRIAKPVGAHVRAA